MDTVGSQNLWSFTGGRAKVISTKCSAVRKAPAFEVSSYMGLARRVAELQFMNRNMVLLFRGQDGDYPNKSGNTSLKPSILRVKTDSKLVPKKETLEKRFLALGKAEALLINLYPDNLPGRQRLARQQILRWSILQHYKVCGTPLLDVTHSLRIAASFASDHKGEAGYIFVVGVPLVSGAITASAEAGLQIVRLSSVCPPSALRPHIQEGYVLGEYPEFRSASQKDHYSYYELDFGRRLVAKFKFNLERFWKNSRWFPQVDREALYPDRRDPLLSIAEDIHTKLSAE